MSKYIPTLNPYAFKIGPLGVHWYGIFMVMAFLGGSYYLIERGKQAGYDPDRLSNVLLLTVLWGMIGARFVFVLANDPRFGPIP
jgi:phosphatidylglycerol:prolipoprotein diacylglycerol transferase